MSGIRECGNRVGGAYRRALVAWVGFVVAHPRLVLLLLAVSVAGSAAYATAHFRLNSDTSKLVHQDAPFRRTYREFNRVFPHYDRTILIVLTAKTHREAAGAARRLAAALRERPDLFVSLYSADEGDFFADNAFLYLDRGRLERVVTRLAEAQPMLATLARDPSLRGLFGQLSVAVDALERGEDIPAGFIWLANRVSEVGEHRLAGRRMSLNWEDEFLGDEPGGVHHLITVQGREDFSAKISSETLLSTIRRIARDLDIASETGVRVRLTGMVPLAYEEMRSAQKSVRLAGGLAFLLLTLIMIFGARSIRVVIATMITVVVGIVWTSAFALATVGEFNTISMAFSVLLIGLGVDFAIHLCLRVQEGLALGIDTATSARTAVRGVGAALSLCALTSAAGFLSFVPTDYDGLADLGIITGGGMFLSLIACLTVTPAMLVSMGTPTGRPARMVLSPAYAGFLVRYGQRVGIAALVLAMAAAVAASRMTFDFSTLGTKDPKSESMTTLRELLDRGILTDYSVTLMAPDAATARRFATELAELPLVKEVRPPEYYLPADQDEKLELLDDANLFLWPALRVVEAKEPPDTKQRIAEIEDLRRKLLALKPSPGTPAAAAARRLGAMLGNLLGAPQSTALAADLDRLVIGDMAERLAWLRRVLAAHRIEFGDLPEALRRRLVSDDGHVLVSAVPREDVSEVAALKHFIDAVTVVSPRATGRPVVEAGVGAIVVRSFYEAATISLVAILLVVYLALRDAVDTVLVLAPLALAGACTMATGVLIHMPFNMANIIVIPLVLGMGVDNGIHIVLRFRDEKSLASVLGSSTPRAIILSSLTTLAAFGALAVSSHRGIHSMGVLLSIAIVALLASTLIVLPALLAWRAERVLTAAGVRVRATSESA